MDQIECFDGRFVECINEYEYEKFEANPTMELTIFALAILILAR